MKIKYLIILLFLNNIAFSQVKVNLDLGYFGKRDLNIDSDYSFKKRITSQGATLDSTQVIAYLRKAIKNIQFKVYMSPKFNEEDFLEPNNIDFTSLIKELYIFSNDSHFGKSGNHRIIETSLKKNIITLKEYQIKDLSTINAFLEVKVNISILDKPKIISLSVTKYKNCYCDELVNSCDNTVTFFFPKSSKYKIKIPYGCINEIFTETSDH